MIDSFAPAHLKLVGFPARSPLPIAALPSMSLFPKAPFDLSVCPSMSLDSRRLHSRAGYSTFTLRFSLVGFERLDLWSTLPRVPAAGPTASSHRSRFHRGIF